MSRRAAHRRLHLVLLAVLAVAGCGDHREIRPEPAPAVVGPAPPPPPAPAEARPADATLLALPDPIPVAEPRATRGNPPFYEVYGTRSTVMREAHGYVERGVASWYGPDFHGLKTSTGEPYDMYGLTAAHKTLPLPAFVEVTNLKNGRSVVVRVNDRGPFKANRIIDLSYTAALKLGMLREGTSLVEVRALDPGGVIPAPPPPAPIYAQAGAFASVDNANRLRDQLLGAGFQGVSVFQARRAGEPLYRVRVGPIATVDQFDSLVARLETEGVHHAWLSAPGNAETALP